MVSAEPHRLPFTALERLLGDEFGQPVHEQGPQGRVERVSVRDRGECPEDAFGRIECARCEPE